MPLLNMDDELAWEIAVPKPIMRGVMIQRLAASLRGGIIAGLVPAMILFGIYVIEAWEWGLPWLRIASVVAVYAPISGVLLAVCVELPIVWLDRVGAAWWPLRIVANPLAAGVIGGAFAGIAPGAFGVPVFGSYAAPFVGTAPLCCACIAAAALVILPIARRCGVAAIPASPCMLATPISIARLAAAVLAPIVVDTAFVQVNNTLDQDGPIIGAACGAIGGAFLGLYVGLVVVLGRLVGMRIGWRVPRARLE